MDHQQAVPFHLPAAQKKVHGTWITPPCLSVLNIKEYLGPKDPQITWDYWEVLKEETVVLAFILQRCIIWAKAPPDVFCGAVQELLEYLVPVVGEVNLFNMEQEIWEEIRKDGALATTSTGIPTPERTPSLKRVLSQMPRVEELTHSTTPDPPSKPKPEGATPLQDLALVPRR